MSRSLARLNSATRCLQPIPSGSVLAPPRTTSVLRRCLHTPAASQRGRAGCMACANDAQRIRFLVTRHQHTDAQGRDGQAPLEEVLSTNSKTVDAPEPSIPVVEATRKSSVNPDTSEDSRFARHLNAQLSPLKFPPEMARRILTHASHKKAPIDGHNARMSFIGRRVLHSYLTLFLASSPAADPSHDFEQIATRALNTYVLGQHVAPKLQLSRVLRWQPAVNPIITGRPDIQPKYDSIPAKGAEKDAELALALRAHPMLLKSVGLYKVMGEAVQAIVGGTYHQFGASVTHRLFHQRILPHLLIRGPLGLHEAYHADAFNRAKTVCEGAEGGLVRHKGGN